MELEDLRFSPEHIWVYLEEGQPAVIGLSEWAFQDQDMATRARMAGEGEEIIKDETFGRLTTAKPSVIRLYAPVSGEIIEVNAEVLDAPELIVEDPYDEGWILRISITNMAEYDDLMTYEEYEGFLGEDHPDEGEPLDDELGDDLDDDDI